MTTDETLLLTQKIKAYYNTKVFTKSDYHIAEYIMEHPAEIAKSTAVSVGEATGTSSATVIRFCRKLGFDGFSEMKYNASGYMLDTAASLNLNSEDDVKTIKGKVLNYTKMILNRLNDQLDEDALGKAASLLSSAKHVIVVSEGGSSTMAQAAYYDFLKLAIPCKFITDPVIRNMEVSTMDKGDLMFIMSNSGRAQNVYNSAQYAKELGLNTVGIVGMENTPLSKYLDVEIRTDVFSSDYFSDISAAMVCDLMVISILHSIISLTRTEEQIETGRRITSATEKFRI